MYNSIYVLSNTYGSALVTMAKPGDSKNTILGNESSCFVGLTRASSVNFYLAVVV